MAPYARREPSFWPGQTFDTVIIAQFDLNHEIWRVYDILHKDKIFCFEINKVWNCHTGFALFGSECSYGVLGDHGNHTLRKKNASAVANALLVSPGNMRAL